MSQAIATQLPNKKLKQSLGFHAEVLVIPDDNMVEDINADDLSGFYQPFRQADILLGSGNIAGRVIMDENNRGLN